MTVRDKIGEHVGRRQPPASQEFARALWSRRRLAGSRPPSPPARRCDPIVPASGRRGAAREIPGGRGIARSRRWPRSSGSRSATCARFGFSGRSSRNASPSNSWRTSMVSNSSAPRSCLTRLSVCATSSCIVSATSSPGTAAAAGGSGPSPVEPRADRVVGELRVVAHTARGRHRGWTARPPARRRTR